ncbi:MAG: hypothetical protein HZA93_29375 [Verrucomicrobia bacterium]|nr:hypothetical protein [Verrucomicrobiota bacterium]
MKKLLALVLSLALCVSLLAAAAPKQIAFDAPVDASRYAAGAATVTQILPLSFDFQTGQLRFQLLDAGGATVAGGAVFGVLCADSADATIKAAVLAALAATAAP